MANKRPILTIYGDTLHNCRPGSNDWVSQGHAVTTLGAAMAAYRNVLTGRAGAAVIYNELGNPSIAIYNAAPFSGTNKNKPVIYVQGTGLRHLRAQEVL